MIRLSSQERNSLIRLASSLPKGDETRRAILSGLKSAGLIRPMEEVIDFDEYVGAQKIHDPIAGVFAEYSEMSPESQAQIYETFQEKKKNFLAVLEEWNRKFDAAFREVVSYLKENLPDYKFTIDDFEIMGIGPKREQIRIRYTHQDQTMNRCSQWDHLSIIIPPHRKQTWGMDFRTTMPIWYSKFGGFNVLPKSLWNIKLGSVMERLPYVCARLKAPRVKKIREPWM